MTHAPDVNIGYFTQHQLEQLDPAASPLLHLRRVDAKASEQSLRDFLGRFNFVGDRVFEAIAPFSGGEKARLALALVVYSRPNLLLLDEPTNHLDLDMRHALEIALQDFAGAVVIVSHDRHLLMSCCDGFWRVADGQCVAFDGDLDDYAKWLLSRPKNSANNTKASTGKAGNSTPVAAPPKVLDTKAIAKLESTMSKLQARLEELEKDLADPALYANPANAVLAKLLQQQTQAKAELAAAEEAWLAAQ